MTKIDAAVGQPVNSRETRHVKRFRADTDGNRDGPNRGSDVGTHPAGRNKVGLYGERPLRHHPTEVEGETPEEIRSLVEDKICLVPAFTERRVNHVRGALWGPKCPTRR